MHSGIKRPIMVIKSFSRQDFVGVKNALHDHDDRHKQSTHMDDI